MTAPNCTTGDACIDSGACVGTVTPACDPEAACITTTAFGDIDLTPAHVTGNILFSGGLPSHSQSPYALNIYLRPRSTGVMQVIEWLDFDSWDGTGYPREMTGERDDGVIDAAVIPGVYDVVYRRWAGSNPEWPQYFYPGDAYASGEVVLQEGVVLGPGATTLNVDLTPAQVTGSLTFDGGFPSHSKSLNEANVYLRPLSTGTMQVIEWLDFDSWDGTGYPLTSSPIALVLPIARRVPPPRRVPPSPIASSPIACPPSPVPHRLVLNRLEDTFAGVTQEDYDGFIRCVRDSVDNLNPPTAKTAKRRLP